jgi:cytochrome c oxidase subunit 2
MILEFDSDSYMLPTSDLVLGDFRLLEVDNVILLPIGTYIRVNITSSDVLHC